jgi:hypothetical protein
MRSSPASAERSWIELEGTVETTGTLEAPLTGLPCVLYRVELGLLQRLLEGGHGARREVAGTRFVVRSTRTGGEVLVDPRGAELWLRRQTAVRRRVSLGRDPALDARLNRLYARLRRGLTRRRHVVCREQRLQTGARVWLEGPLLLLTDAAGQPQGYRAPPTRALLEARLLVVLDG